MGAHSALEEVQHPSAEGMDMLADPPGVNPVEDVEVVADHAGVAARRVSMRGGTA